MATLRISAKGWVAIPAELRSKYSLAPSSEVRIVDYGGVLSLIPVMEDPVGQAAGMVKGTRPLTEALLAEHAAERAQPDQTLKRMCRISPSCTV